VCLFILCGLLGFVLRLVEGLVSVGLVCLLWVFWIMLVVLCLFFCLVVGVIVLRTSFLFCFICVFELFV